MVDLNELLRRAVTADLPYSQRLGASGGRPAAVLALFGTDEKGEISLLLTRRTDTLDHHRGQMAFPGGARDLLEEGSHEDAVTAALRETEEEVGVSRELVRVIGELPSLYTPTGFQIHPVVGLLLRSISEVPLVPNADEIAAALWIPLATLQSERTYRLEKIEAGPIQYANHVFQVSDHRIWGATGAMVRNLLDRLEQASGP